MNNDAISLRFSQCFKICVGLECFHNTRLLHTHSLVPCPYLRKYEYTWTLKISLTKSTACRSHDNNCNVPNFGPTIYKHEPIDHDDYIDVLFNIGSKTPLHMNIMIVLYIECKTIVNDIYVYIYDWLCWAWTLKHMIDEMFCVGSGPWSTWSMRCFVLSERL